MDKEFLENIPNAGRLMEALRNTGYSNISAISDLVDNSIDAEATKIHIKLQLSPQNLQDSQVIVADDGYGMSWETLRQAMRLGSDVFHDLGRDLGKYGMGLVTASISIGRRLTVISRKDGLTNTAIQDLDTIIERNRFEISLRPATESESELFDQETGNATSGTVVIISNCDRIQYAKENDFAKALEDEIGRIFRVFLRSADRNIYINDQKVEMTDPLWLNDSKTDIILDEDCEIELNGVPKQIHLRAVLLPDFGRQVNIACGFNMKNQGFYLMRNRREIASGITLGIIKKHNDYNRMRIELEFGSDLDDDMGINFTKRDAKPSPIIIDKVTEITDSLLETVRRRMKSEQTARRLERAAKASVDETSPSASDSSTAEPQPNKTEPSSTPTSSTLENSDQKSPSEPQSIKASTSSGNNSVSTPSSTIVNSNSAPAPVFEFEERPLVGERAFDIITVGPKRIISYNVNSPFYQKMVSNAANPAQCRAVLDRVITATLTASALTKFDDAAVKAFNRNFLQALQED